MLYLHGDEMDSYAVGIHSWAQMDRYALAEGFTLNGLDLFSPQTRLLNRQFPDDWARAYDSPITSVDLPLHEYTVAIVMRLTGMDGPSVFRWSTFLWSILLSWGLFSLGLRQSKDPGFAVLFTAMMCSSAVFLNYSTSFLPTIPCLALSVIGIERFLHFITHQRLNSLLVGMAVMTAAMVMRPTFIIPFIASCIGVLMISKHIDRSLIVGLLLMIPLFIFGCCQWYKAILYDTHGSLFLNVLPTFESVDTLLSYLDSANKRWSLVFFSTPMIISLSAASLSAIITVFSPWRRQMDLTDRFVINTTMAHLVGSIAFVLVMAIQFVSHDYYLLDSIFILVGLILLGPLSYVFRMVKPSIILSIVLTASGLIVLLHGAHQYPKHYAQKALTKNKDQIDGWKSLDAALLSNEIDYDARLLILDADALNLPLILLKRYGFVAKKLNQDQMDAALGWEFDAVLFNDFTFVDHTLDGAPKVYERLQAIDHRGGYTLCKVKPLSTEGDLTDLLSRTSEEPLIRSTINTEDLTGWTNIDERDTAGNVVVAATQKYGPSYILTGSEDLAGARVLASMEVDGSSKPRAHLVLSVEREEHKLYYKAHRTSKVRERNHQNYISNALMDLPLDLTKDDIIKVYLLNSLDNPMLVKELSVTVFR